MNFVCNIVRALLIIMMMSSAAVAVTTASNSKLVPNSNKVELLFREAKCGKKGKGNDAYVSNKNNDLLRVTVRVSLEGRKYDSLKSYVLEPGQETRVGCTVSGYKEGNPVRFKIYKVKVTNYWALRTF